MLWPPFSRRPRRDGWSRGTWRLWHSIPPGAKAPVVRRALSIEEAADLIEAAREDEDGKYYPLIVVALYCGLRPGEVTGSPWSAIDLDEGTLTVLQSRKVGPDGKMTIGATKTHSDRVLALPKIVQEALRAHEVRQARERKEAPAWEDHGLVFANEIGRPIDPSIFSGGWSSVCAQTLRSNRSVQMSFVIPPPPSWSRLG